MDAQEQATLLLIMRIIATILLTAVVVKQVINIRTKTTEWPVLRVMFMVGTIILLVGQFIPILLDAIVAFGSNYPGRNRNPNILASGYAFNNATKDVIIGLLLTLWHYAPTKPRKKH